MRELAVRKQRQDAFACLITKGFANQLFSNVILFSSFLWSGNKTISFWKKIMSRPNVKLTSGFWFQSFASDLVILSFDTFVNEDWVFVWGGEEEKRL